MTAATFSLEENSANGTAVGTVTATDIDAATTLTYSITGGNTGGAFAINAATGAITVAASAAVNFETTPSFSLTVTATEAFPTGVVRVIYAPGQAPGKVGYDDVKGQVPDQG